MKSIFWMEYLVGTILFGIIVAVCASILFPSVDKLHDAKQEATEYFHCEQVVFGFNDDESSPKPLGYYVETRNYEENGQMTKDYQYHENAKAWYNLNRNTEITVGIAGFIGVIATILTLLEIYLLISGIFFIRRLNKDSAERAKAALESYAD